MRVQPPILTASPVSRRLIRLARRYAAVDGTVLIIGETGVGKDVLARYLHDCGPRQREPFITVDCPALPATLGEAELFGHERGAFTDAGRARPGRFEMAGRGTVYLDAVTELGPAHQGALLRLLEERRVTRLGSVVAIDLHARIIASADVSLDARLADGSFRQDLFHRLSVLPLAVPPLRERADDILPLTRQFLSAVAALYHQPVPALSHDVEDLLLHYHWPGNIRELRHLIERLVLVGADRIEVSHLPAHLLDPDLCLAPVGVRRPTLAEIERRYIALTLGVTRGNQTGAARILGISRKGLWEKRKRFALD